MERCRLPVIRSDLSITCTAVYQALDDYFFPLGGGLLFAAGTRATNGRAWVDL
jgi:hypothetical protein